MAKYLGKGTKLRRKDPATGIFADLAQVQSIEGPTSSADQVDVTALDSPGGYREFIPGLKDGGELTFALILDPVAASFLAINADFEAQENRDWEVVLPNAAQTKISFAGAVTSRSVTIPVEDAIKLNVAIKVSGEVTIV